MRLILKIDLPLALHPTPDNLLPTASVSLVPALSAAVVLWLGGQRVQTGLLGTEDLWLFWGLIGMLTFPTMMLGFVVSITQRGLAALERLGAVLDIVPSIRDR